MSSEPTSTLPTNSVRILDHFEMGHAHVSGILLIDDLEVPFDYLSVFGHPEAVTELRVRIPRSRVRIERDRNGVAKSVRLAPDGDPESPSIPVLVAKGGVEEVVTADCKQWVDLTLLPTTITFGREES